MKLRQYHVSDDQIIVDFNGRPARLEKVWDAIKRLRGLSDHDEHYLVVSNTDRVLMYFTGQRSGQHYYISGITPLSDKPFRQWKALQRELDVRYLELVADGKDGRELESMMTGLGLKLVSKRIEFTISDPDRVHFDVDGVQQQDHTSLEEIVALCELARCVMDDPEDLLANAAAGAIDVQLRLTERVLTSALFYSTLNEKTLVSEGFISAYRVGSIDYAQEFVQHFHALLVRCAKEKKSLSIALAAEATIPPYDGIKHEVVTYHYSIA